MFSQLAFSFLAIVVSVSSDVEGDEESQRLAWAVRKLVGNCSRADYGRPFYRVGKMGPRGPKGEPGKCECDILNEGGIQQRLQAMEETIANMKFAYPDNPPNQWVEVDLGRIRNITGVITQGQGNIRNPLLVEWVTSFKIEYGTRQGSRRSLIENGYTKIFSPVNFDPITKVVTRFPDPITARFVRIVPTAYHGHMSMRFDFIDC